MISERQYLFSLPYLRSGITQGFTIFELIIAISIGALLLLFVVAPYNFYADKSRVRLSVERIEQAMNKGKLFVGTGYSRGDANVDVLLHITKGTGEIELFSIPVGATPGDSARKTIEKISLETNVLVSRIGDTDTLESIDIVYRSPVGLIEVWNAGGASPTKIDTGIPTQGTVGIKGVATGTLAKTFKILSN